MSPTLLGLFLTVAAPAAEVIDVHTDDDGVTHGTVLADVSEEALRAHLTDGAALAVTSPDVRRATATPDGACEQLDLDVLGLLQTMDVTTRRCPTAQGWREDLVASRAFTRWTSTWTVSTTDDGRARLAFTVQTRLSFPVPQGILTARTRHAVRVSLGALADALAPSEATLVAGTETRGATEG